MMACSVASAGGGGGGCAATVGQRPDTKMKQAVEHPSGNWSQEIDRTSLLIRNPNWRLDYLINIKQTHFKDEGEEAGEGYEVEEDLQRGA